MKTVAILTSFSDLQKAYSLNIIVQGQIKMLLLAGYKPIVIVHDTLVPEGIYAHPGVKIERIPNVPCHNEVKKDDSFDEDVTCIEKRLEEILKNVDICITHDIIYQNACLKHNVASRRVAKKLPKLKWLHWIHSATSPLLLNMVRPMFSDEYVRLLETPFPNSFYVYPNEYAVPSVARNFNVPVENVKVVHHPTDICGFYGMDPEVEKVVYQYDMLNVDAMATYPCRLDTGKQVEMVVKTMAMLRDFGLSIRVLCIDFHSTGPEKIEYRNKIKQVAIEYGLNSDELLFTSELNTEWELECPQSVVRDFQMISNVFIMPSVSETYSLVAQEAALTKQVVVMNQDFPPYRSIYGEFPIYKKYSSAYDVMADPAEGLRPDSWTGTEYGAANLPKEARKEAEKQYHRGTAGEIANRLKHPEMALSRFLMKNRNLQYIMKHELEPLFWA